MNKENIVEVMKKFGIFLEENYEYYNSTINKINGMLDDMRDDDEFGTEGQCDPRGDGRDD
jgi:hypothetical protein